jgi:sulfatase modifying factor 1
MNKVIGKLFDLFMVAALSASVVATAKAISIDLVTVGDPGNVADSRNNLGSVAKSFAIGKYEVTAGQYTSFLNAVAATDPYECYSTDMGGTDGCNIQRSGTAGHYTYSVATNWATRPVNYVSFWRAARFTNWLQNGQPIGQETAATTEDGAYTLNGFNGYDNSVMPVRNTGATWVVPSINEWYKAAYYKGGGTNAGYWTYPTKSNSPPTASSPPGLMVPPGSANLNGAVGTTTNVGSYTGSAGPYGTFDQAGNVNEWIDTMCFTGWPTFWRGYCGGQFEDYGGIGYQEGLAATDVPHWNNPGYGMFPTRGFRVEMVPEPSTLVLLCMGTLSLLYICLRRKQLLFGKAILRSILALIMVASTIAAHAVTIDMVSVGNPGNAPDTRTSAQGGTPGCGSVGYTYNIGKYEVTASQYCQFLNAVAADDPYGLYNTNMYTGDHGGTNGCTIQQNGSPGSYYYTISADWANRPVNHVNWGDAARFCNWLQKGQPTGAEGPSTTETGAYTLNGVTDFYSLTAMKRNTDAKYFIPNVDEWYKAAYYDPNKPGGAGYWTYPTKSDTPPSNVVSATGTNNALFDNWDNHLNLPYCLTEVGTFAKSPSPYGTFDQGGNVEEWTETPVGSTDRVMRGGDYYWGADWLAANYQISGWPSDEVNYQGLGFRVASVPEPSTLVLLGMGALALIFVGRCKRAG